MDHIIARRLLGIRIRTLRKERNITQERLAELINKTTEHISFLERGERSPSFEVLFDIAQAFNISLSDLINIDGLSSQTTKISAPPPLSTEQLPNSIEDPIKPVEQRKSDIQRLQEGFENLRALQKLANEYGIFDILQDNGGKVLQLLIILGLKQSKGREGNDAVDDDGNEYELKTINHSLNPNAGITTHHHLTEDIIKKYRKVIWYIGIYKGIELVEIWKVHPNLLEPVFSRWTEEIRQRKTSLNNPKIPLRYIRLGEQVYRNQ